MAQALTVVCSLEVIWFAKFNFSNPETFLRYRNLHSPKMSFEKVNDPRKNIVPFWFTKCDILTWTSCEQNGEQVYRHGNCIEDRQGLQAIWNRVLLQINVLKLLTTNDGLHSGAHSHQIKDLRAIILESRGDCSEWTHKHIFTFEKVNNEAQQAEDTLYSPMCLSAIWNKMFHSGLVKASCVQIINRISDVNWIGQLHCYR